MRTQKENGEKPKAADRRERWRVQIEKVIAEVSANKNFLLPDVFEAVEGRGLSEVITDRVCEIRGYGVERPNEEQKFQNDRDTWYEANVDDKRLIEHDRDIARFAVYHFLMARCPFDKLGPDELRRFVRKFYRPGDYGLIAAERRAILTAIGGR